MHTREIFEMSCLFCDSPKAEAEDAHFPFSVAESRPGTVSPEPSSVIQTWNIGNVIGMQIEIIWEDSVIQ